MNRHLAYFLIMICCTGCSVVSKQYYYVPDATHSTTKEKAGYSKMIYSKIDIPDSSGNNIGSIITSNGAGIPLFAGPAYVPVVPVGIVAVFNKKERYFGMDIIVNVNQGYFMTLAVDSNNYKKVNDSLAALKVATVDDLHTTDCYMIVNGSTKVPLRVKEYFMRQTNSHSYQMYAPIRFEKVRTVTIITGNPLLDRRLKNMVFKQKTRITHSIYWVS